MDFSASGILSGFVFGVIGFYMLAAARKSGSVPRFVIGLVLMVYPYFVTHPYLTWAVGAGLVFLAMKVK